MKKNYFWILLFLPFMALAQEPTLHPCGTPSHHSDWFNEYARNRTAYRTGADTMLYVPLTLHVLGTDDGTGYLSMMKILDGFCGMNDDFAGSTANMQFYIEGDVNYIDKTAWYNHTHVVSGYNMMLQNNVPNTINTYFVANPAGNAGYNLPSSDGIAMSKGATNENSHTWAHEIGHNLSVQHPFLGWEGQIYSYSNPTPATVTYNYTSFKTTFFNSNDTTIIDTAFVELVDGSNCAIAADKICDTPPDYLSFGGWQCNSNGLSTILQKDPNNVDFRSDATNIMTYANDACGSKFTAGQIAAMRANLLSQKASYLYNQNLQVDTIDATANLMFPTPGEVTDFSAVDFIWNAVPKATHYVIQVSLVPSFSVLHDEVTTTDTIVTMTNFMMNRKYYWRVRPFNRTYTCTNVTPTQDFTTSDLADVNEVAGVEQYQIVPNPITAGQHLRLDINATQVLDAEVSVVASNGQVIEQMSITLQNGQNQHFIPTQRLSAGMYVLFIQTANGTIRDKFVVF